MKGDDKNWLLMKNKSDSLSKKKEFTAKSVLSDRTMDEISKSEAERTSENRDQKEENEVLQKKT